MRKLMTLVSAVGLGLVAGPAMAIEPLTEGNAQYMESVLRAEAARQGIELPEFSTLTTSKMEWNASTGTMLETEVPLDQELRYVASLMGPTDLADPTLAATTDVPTMGVGHNIHVYASIRMFQCNPKGYYEGWYTSAEVPPVGFVPNPLFPVVPVMGATVWGGPGFHVTGGGWLIGVHGFVGAPIDLNVNTGGSTAGAPVSPFLSAGFNRSLDTAAVGRVGMSSKAIRLFGRCIASIDLGYIFENGVLAVNGQVIPENPAGL